MNTCDRPIKFTVTDERPYSISWIPEYVLKLASKGRGVCCHKNPNGRAKKQRNYILYEGQ